MNNYFLNLSILMFVIGFIGLLLNNKNIIKILLSIEIMIISSIINFTSQSAFSESAIGMSYSVFVFTIAAVEIAIGISIAILYHKKHNSIEI